jgi:STAS domain.
MLRITETMEDEKTVALILDGKVADVWVLDLESICLHHKNEKDRTVVLNFSGVTFVDDNGLRMLERIKDERIKIVNCSLFIEALLGSLISSSKRQG